MGEKKGNSIRGYQALRGTVLLPIDVELLDLAGDVSRFGPTAKLSVSSATSFVHLLAGLERGERQYFLKFRSVETSDFTYLFVTNGNAVLFQNPGDFTLVVAGGELALHPKDHVVVTEPQWGLIFMLPRSKFVPFRSVIPVVTAILETGEMPPSIVLAQGLSEFGYEPGTTPLSHFPPDGYS